MRSTLKALLAHAGVAVSRIPSVPPAFADQRVYLATTPARCICDLGASTGGFSIQYRQLFPEAEVYAFEALRQHFDELVVNTQADSLIKPLHLAVSDVTGQVELNVNRLPDTSSILAARADGDQSVYRTMHRETVDSVTLDHFAAAHGLETIEIVKMDIQGAELRALRGAERLLREQRIALVYCEVLFRELYDQQPFFHNIAGFLQEMGYRLINLYNFVHHGRELQWADALFASARTRPH